MVAKDLKGGAKGFAKSYKFCLEMEMGRREQRAITGHWKKQNMKIECTLSRVGGHELRFVKVNQSPFRVKYFFMQN